MTVENNVLNNNSVNHSKENVNFENFPREIKEKILSYVPTLDSNHNLLEMRLISQDINHTISYSKNERIQELFKNLLNNNLEKDIEEIKEIINFCNSFICSDKVLSNAYLQISKSKAGSEDKRKKLDEISNQIYSTDLLDDSQWNNEEKKIIFFNAYRLGHVKIIKDFIEQGFVDPSANENDAIKEASSRGHTEVVQLLLKDKRVDPSHDDNEAIKWASENGHKEVVELLLKDKRVNPSAYESYAIRAASEYGRKEVVELLLNDRRADPTAENNYAIRMASCNGHNEVVELLLKDERVNPSAINNEALILASRRRRLERSGLPFEGHKDVVELLLKDKRVDPSVRNNYAIRRAASEEIKTILIEWAINNPNRRGSAEILKFINKN